MKPWVLVVVLALATNGMLVVGRLSGQTPPAQERQATVTLVIKSDEQTWVSITKVRPPEKFKSQTVQLKPGVYEIVGRRKGYRDESVTVEVREGMRPINVSIICTVNAGG